MARVIGDITVMLPGPMRRWCSWIYWGERGTTLTYGWAIDARGALSGVHGPTEYLIKPEGDEAPRWIHASSIDFRPIRREPPPDLDPDDPLFQRYGS